MSGRMKGERRLALEEARALIVQALDLLDSHARSSAAANLDLALHRLSEEIEGHAARACRSARAKSRPFE
jgi:hypothetical protein